MESQVEDDSHQRFESDDKAAQEEEPQDKGYMGTAQDQGAEKKRGSSKGTAAERTAGCKVTAGLERGTSEADRETQRGRKRREPDASLLVVKYHGAKTITKLIPVVIWAINNARKYCRSP